MNATDTPAKANGFEQTAPKIYATIVSYNPNSDRLQKLVNQIADQVSCIIVIDNASMIDPSNSLDGTIGSTPCKIIRLDQNHGIAYAQNVGIKIALEEGAEYVILFDHDSSPPSELVLTLLQAHQKKEQEGLKVAAVGPRFVDSRNPTLGSFVKLSGITLKKISCSDKESIPAVDHLIASGALISRKAIEEIGMMREDLFIDYVDIEWCLRAHRAGYKCFGVCGVAMPHDLGGEPIMLLGRTHTNHSAVRQYFLFRNRTFLYQLEWIPLRWKIADGIRLLLRYALYTSIAWSKPSHWKMMHRGLWDGLRRNLGSIDHHTK